MGLGLGYLMSAGEGVYSTGIQLEQGGFLQTEDGQVIHTEQD